MFHHVRAGLDVLDVPNADVLDVPNGANLFMLDGDVLDADDADVLDVLDTAGGTGRPLHARRVGSLRLRRR